MRKSGVLRNFVVIITVVVAFVCLGVAQSSKVAKGTPVTKKAQAAPVDMNQRLINPGELAGILRSPKGPKPLLFQVGSRVMYQQAHIPGSEYIGAGSEESGRAQLRNRVKNLPRNKAIVLYCGCCPWIVCPNVKPAFDELQAMGFTNVKVLYMANNFGADWVQRGYPTAQGN